MAPTSSHFPGRLLHSLKIAIEKPSKTPSAVIEPFRSVSVIRASVICRFGPDDSLPARSSARSDPSGGRLAAILCLPQKRDAARFQHYSAFGQDRLTPLWVSVDDRKPVSEWRTEMAKDNVPKHDAQEMVEPRTHRRLLQFINAARTSQDLAFVPQTDVPPAEA